MEESILKTIKKLLGIHETENHFDRDLIIHINSVLLALTQIGVGPEDGFTISGIDETWKDFIGEMKMLEAVKTWVYLKVRLIFDPPANSILEGAIEKNLKELEWRIGVVADPTPWED